MTLLLGNAEQHDVVRRRWLSIYISDLSAASLLDLDELLGTMVRPVVHTLTSLASIDQFFFIRYFEEDAHIRLRLQVAAGKEPAALEAISEAVEASSLRERVAIRRRDYEPELERYGGAVNMNLAELHFEASSALALEVLPPEKRMERKNRLGIGTMSFILMCRAFIGDSREIASLLWRFKAGTRLLVEKSNFSALEIEMLVERRSLESGHTVRVLWEQCGDDYLLPDPLVAFADSLAASASALKDACSQGIVSANGAAMSYKSAVGFLLPSYLHMHANRLGLTRFEELLLAHCIAKAIDSTSDGLRLIQS